MCEEMEVFSVKMKMDRRSRAVAFFVLAAMALSLFAPHAAALGMDAFGTDAGIGLTAHEAAFLGLLDYDHAESLARHLSEEIGNRITFSPRRDMAAEWIMDELASYGYEPYIHEFDYSLSTAAATRGDRVAVSPTVNGILWIGGKHYAYHGPAWAASTVYQYDSREALAINGAAVVDWPAQSQPFALPEGDYAGKAVFVRLGAVNTGAAAATMPSAANAYAAALALQSAGAAAVVFQTPAARTNPNGAVGDTTYARIANTASGTAITIPVGTSLYYETDGILGSLGAGDAVFATMYASNVGKNILAVLPSATGSDKTVYLTAHYDSMGSGPGMNDNGSGTIMQLEMARAFRNWQFGYNIVFFFCDSEESGLRGAYAYCDDMPPEERANFVANYNMDMISTAQEDCIHFFLNISDTRLQPFESPLANDQRLIDVPAAVEVAKEYDVFNHSYLAAQKTGFDMDYFNICYDTTTDHYAFVRFGNGYFGSDANMVNAVEYDWRRNEKGTSFETLYHKEGDTYAANFSRERLEKAGDIIALAIYYSALGTQAPAVPVVGVSVDERVRYGDKVEYAFAAEAMDAANLIELTFEIDGNILGAADGAMEGQNGFAVFSGPDWASLGDGRLQGKAIIGVIGSGQTRSGDMDVAKLALDAARLGDAKLTLSAVSVYGIDIVDGVARSSQRATALSPAYATAKVYSIYDVNGDDEVGLADLSLAFYYYMSTPASPDWDAAMVCDVNGDGRVDMGDLIEIYANFI